MAREEEIRKGNEDTGGITRKREELDRGRKETDVGQVLRMDEEEE